MTGNEDKTMANREAIYYASLASTTNDTLISSLLEQNRALMGLVAQLSTQSSPVEVIKALNPPPAAPVAAPIPWADDPERNQPADPWADERVTTTQLREGWGDNPGVSISRDPYGQDEMLNRFNQNISGDQIGMEGEI